MCSLLSAPCSPQNHKLGLRVDWPSPYVTRKSQANSNSTRFPASHLSQNRKRVTRSNSRRRSGSEMVSIPQSHNSRYQWVAAISRPSWVSLSAAMSFPKDASTLHHEHAARRTSPGSAPPLLRCPEARTPGAAIRILLLILFTASFEQPFETKRRALESSRARELETLGLKQHHLSRPSHSVMALLDPFPGSKWVFILFVPGRIISVPSRERYKRKHAAVGQGSSRNGYCPLSHMTRTSHPS